MTKKKNPGGRPPKYKTAGEMQKKIDEYFNVRCADEIIKDGKGIPIIHSGKPVVKHHPPTISGLALYLGFLDRRALYYHIESKGQFFHTVKQAVAFIEDYAERQLFVGNPTGAIFWLKNRGWSDKQEVEQSGEIKHTVSWICSKGEEK